MRHSLVESDAEQALDGDLGDGAEIGVVETREGLPQLLPNLRDVHVHGCNRKVRVCHASSCCKQLAHPVSTASCTIHRVVHHAPSTKFDVSCGNRYTTGCQTQNGHHSPRTRNSRCTTSVHGITRVTSRAPPNSARPCQTPGQKDKADETKTQPEAHHLQAPRTRSTEHNQNNLAVNLETKSLPCQYLPTFLRTPSKQGEFSLRSTSVDANTVVTTFSQKCGS